MFALLADAIAQFEAAPSDQEVWRAFGDFMARAGVPVYLAVRGADESDSTTRRLLATNIPLPVLEKLDIAAAGTRPVRRLALDTERSFLLSERREALLRTDGARGWFDTFSGLAGGMDLLVIPVRRERALLGIGMLVGPRALFDDATVGALVTATNAAFAAFARVRPACAGDGDRRPRLTPREKSILDLMANGLSEEEVAATLGLSRRTVSFHLDEARARLGDEVRRFAVDIARERARRR